MKKIIQFFLILFLFIGHGSAQTNVSGLISSNSTWTISGSPYIVTGNILVSSGITLTIKPGVVVKFNQNLYLRILGKLIAVGKSDSLISFEANGSIANNYWAGIQIKSGLDSNYANVTISEMKYVNIKNAVTGLYLYQSAFLLSNSTLSINTTAVELRATDTVQINQCNFLTNITGIFSEYEPQGPDYYGNITKTYIVQNNFINNNNGIALNMNQRIFRNLNILNNYFSQNADPLHFGGGGYGPNIDAINIENNIIYNNGMGIVLDRVYGALSPLTYPLRCTKNIVVDNQNASLELEYTTTQFLIEENIFKNKTGNGIEFFGSPQSSNHFFKKNQIISNGNNILFGGNTLYSAQSMHFAYNTLSGRPTARMIYQEYGGGHNFNNNNFSSNSGSYSMYNNTVKNIDAKNNYWTDTTNTIIDNLIYDMNDDFNKGIVDYSGYLKSPDTIAPMTPPSYAVKKKVNGGVQFKWNAVKEKDLSGYKMYYGNPTGYSFSNYINAGNVTSYFMPSASITDTFAITAYDIGADGINDQVQGRESWFSNFEIASINNLDTVYCANASSVNLIATPTGGIYSGAGISGNVFNPSVAGVGTHKVLYIYPSPAGNNDTVSVTVNVNAAPAGGNLNATANAICIGDSVKLTLSGYSGFIQWQSSIDGTTWNNIPGATSSSYHTGILISTKYYRTVLSNGVCTPVYSNPVNIVVSPISQAGIVSINKTEICIGDNAALTLSGYTGNIQWQSSNDSLVWSDITGANAAIYNTGVINAKMYYRAIVTSGVCSSDTSIIRSVEVNALPTIAVTPMNSTSFCAGGGTLLSATMNSNYIYQWQMNTSAISGANLSSYSATQTGNYSVKVTDVTTSCVNMSTPVNINSIILSLQPTPICIVGVDSASGKNFIAWEKPATEKIKSFYIYKETSVSNVYAKIGKVDYSSFSAFIDTSSNPKIQSDSYKISVLDSCAVETSQSGLHKTIHLNINQGSGTTWNLIWNDYEGFTVSNYRIYRGTSLTNMSLIGTTTAGNTSFSDFSAPSGFVYYQIEVASPNSCMPTWTTPYVSSRSNIASNSANGIRDYENQLSNIEIYPVPNNGVFTIDFYSAVYEKAEIKIVDMLGSKVFEEGNIFINFGKQSKTVNIGELAKGVYFLHFQSKAGSFTKMIVVDK